MVQDGLVQTTIPGGGILTLQQRFDPRLNALNAIRLAMALGVIVWHSFPLTGRDIAFHPLRQFIAEVWVDGFFAISGFLITASWMRRPQVRGYLVARALRILPAFWICLLIVGFIVAPIGVAMQGGDGRGLLLSTAPIEYVLSNSAVWIFERGVDGTPTGVPYPGTWNGSLWTLGWEVLCYLGVLALGITGLLKRRWTLPIAFAASWALLAATTLADIGGHPGAAARFSIMFLAGALIYQFQGLIRCTWLLTAAAFGVTAATMFLPDYRLLGAVFWAYVVIATGALTQRERLVLKNDISYGVYIYAFPFQQLLYIKFGAIPTLAFAVLAAVPTLLAASASWFAIEKPVMRLRARLDPAPAKVPAAAL